MLSPRLGIVGLRNPRAPGSRPIRYAQNVGFQGSLRPQHLAEVFTRLLYFVNMVKKSLVTIAKLLVFSKRTRFIPLLRIVYERAFDRQPSPS